MKWDKAPIDSDEVRKVSRLYGTDLLVSTILIRRNIRDSEGILFFLEDDLRFLHNPFLFVEMEEAIDRINAAIEGGERIFVYGDRDVDGITSTALLVKTLEELGADVIWGVPLGDDSYGLSIESVDKALSSEVKLIITVDCGISNLKEIQYAREKGADTIVVDHHNPHNDLPHAAALLNPKIEDSGYPFKDLSACALVAKLVWALNFSGTPLYGRTVDVLNIRPLNEAFVLEAVKLENLVEVDRISEKIIPGMIPFERSRLAAFLDGNEAYVYKLELQLSQLKKIFGEVFKINLMDISSLIGEYFPVLSDRSLLQIKENLPLFRYKKDSIEEIDVLRELFVSLILEKEKLNGEKFTRCLDLVALSTLADIMPLVDENRILVRKGLSVINTAQSEPLRELLQKKGLIKKTITTRDIAWQISPVINASGRMGEPHKAVELFLAGTEDEMEHLAAYIIDLNKKRKGLEEGVWDTALSRAKKSYEDTGNKFVLVSGKRVNRGITGLLASRLVKFFKVPAIVVSLMKERATGSLRCPHDFKIGNFLSHFGDLFIDFGGHDYAAGFTMAVEKEPEFEARFYEFVPTFNPPEKEEDIRFVDAEIPLSYLKPDLWNVVEFFEPYGEGNPQLVFLTRGMRIESCDLFGRKSDEHLKMLLDSGRFKWPAILWNGAGRLDTDFSLYDKVDVLYNLSKNQYRNKETLQLIILDINK